MGDYLCLDCGYEPTKEELRESVAHCSKCGYGFSIGTLREVRGDTSYGEHCLEKLAEEMN